MEQGPQARLVGCRHDARVRRIDKGKAVFAVRGLRRRVVACERGGVQRLKVLRSGASTGRIEQRQAGEQADATCRIFIRASRLDQAGIGVHYEKPRMTMNGRVI